MGVARTAGSEAPRVLWVRERIAWMGSRSGYDPLCEALRAGGVRRGHSVDLRAGAPLVPGGRWLLGAVKRRAYGSPFYNVYSAWAELRALAAARLEAVDLVHLTYAENQLGLLARLRGALPGALVATAHQPPGWYRLRHRHASQLAACDAVIALGREQAGWLERVAPGRVHRVRYAVDTRFFRPADEAASTGERAPRLLFGGRWLRDWDTLVGVVEGVLAHEPDVGVDLLVPRDARSDARLLRLARHPQVAWHAGLSDRGLRELYRGATLLLLPLVDCVAVSVLLEAIASGLPVITSDVGAMREYTQEDFASLHPVGDADGMAEAVVRLLRDPAECQRRGKAARAFAERELGWERCARETLIVYDVARRARGGAATGAAGT